MNIDESLDMKWEMSERRASGFWYMDAMDELSARFSNINIDDKD